MSITLKLTAAEAEIFNEVKKQIDETAEFLAGLSHEERLDWLRAHQFSHPINFEREIDGTLYTVNAHFSEQSGETVEEKTNRILTGTLVC